MGRGGPDSERVPGWVPPFALSRCCCRTLDGEPIAGTSLRIAPNGPHLRFDVYSSTFIHHAGSMQFIRSGTRVNRRLTAIFLCLRHGRTPIAPFRSPRCPFVRFVCFVPLSVRLSTLPNSYLAKPDHHSGSHSGAQADELQPADANLITTRARIADDVTRDYTSHFAYITLLHSPVPCHSIQPRSDARP